MADPSAGLLGISLLAGGAAALLLAALLLRVVSRAQHFNSSTPSPVLPEGTPPHNDAILLVKAGGKIAYLNQQARDWFNLQDEKPNLEQLARLAQPRDALLNLCAAETRARLVLNGRFIEGRSYYAPIGNERNILVLLHRPEWVAGSVIEGPGQPSSFSEEAFGMLNEFNQAIVANLELEPTIQAVLEGVQRIIPCDQLELIIWGRSQDSLVSYHIIGKPGEEWRLERIERQYPSSRGYTGYLLSHKRPLLVKDDDSLQEFQPIWEGGSVPFQSYLGIPLQVEDDCIGTLELAKFEPHAYHEHDLEALRILSTQAAAAVHNAQLFEAEHTRARELTRLVNLAQAVNLSPDTDDIWARLVKSIAPLLDVELLGFIHYEENSRKLEWKVPFLGVDDKFTETYFVTIEPGCEGEKVLQSREPIISTNGAEDPTLLALDPQNFAQATGITHTVLAPLTRGDRVLGYIQVAKKRDGSPFDKDDLRMLSIIAREASPLIENFALVQEAKKRAQRSDALRRIASLTASDATLDEILKYSLLDLARLLQADVGMIFLVEDKRGEMVIHQPSTFELEMNTFSRFARVPMNKRAFSDGEEHFIAHRKEDVAVGNAYLPIMDHLQLHSALCVPLTVRNRNIGELLLGSERENCFDQGDVLSAAAAASLMASAVEQYSLYSQTDETLRQRVAQMTALTRISREINTTLDLQHIAQRVFEELLRSTHAECGSLVLFEVSREGRGSDILLHLGDELSPGLSPLEEIVLEREESLIVEDFLSNNGCESPPHPDIRSGMIIPIAYQGEAAGLIHLHSKVPGHFTDIYREIAESLSVQTAIALGNAHRFQEQVERSNQLNRRVETLSQMFEVSQALQTDSLEEALETIAYAIQAATPFEMVLISVYNQQTEHLERVAGVGLPLATMEEFRANTVPWALATQLLEPQFQVGNLYFIPHEKAPVQPPDLHTIVLLETKGSIAEEHSWHAEDLLLLPMKTYGGRPLGLISVDGPRDNRRPDRPTLEILELFRNQAAIAIENFQRVEAFSQQVEAIHHAMERAQQSAQVAQDHLPNLLHRDLEQAIAVRRMSERAIRIRAGLGIIDIVNRQASRSDVLFTLAHEVLVRMNFDIALVAEPGEGGIRLVHAVGDIPKGVTPHALLGQRNPLRSAFQGSGTLLVADVEKETEWNNTPLLHALEARSFVCFPVPGDSGVDSALLALSKAELAAFNVEDALLLSLLGMQVAVAIQNLDLLEQTRRRLREVDVLLEFSRQLGSLDADAVLQSLVASTLAAVPSAQAAMVALWDTAQERLVPRSSIGYADSQRLLEIRWKPGESLIGEAFSQSQLIRVDEVDFARHYNLAPENQLLYRDATAGRPPISTLVIPIVGTTRTQALGVLVADNFKTPGAFSTEDQALLSSLAQQTALTLENARLYRASQRRARQMQALTGVAATITASLQTDELITSLLRQVEAILPYENGTLWLQRGDGKEEMVVRAARGFPDDDQRVGLAVSLEDSALLREMHQTGQPLSIGNVEEDDRFPSLPEYENLSWLGIPLVVAGELIGVIALEKKQPHYYTPEHLQIAQTFASQAAVGLENATLYEESVHRAQELDQRSKRLAMLNRLSGELSGSLDLHHILTFSIQELYKALHCSSITALLFERERAVVAAEYPETEYPHSPVLSPAPIFDWMQQTLGVLNTVDVRTEEDFSPLVELLERHNTHSLLAVPLSTSGNLHGMLLIQTDHIYHFDPDEVEVARTICNQVAIAVQNARLFAETRSLTEDLEQRVVERTQEVAREHQRTETLLRIITELSSSLDLDQVLYRTLKVLNEMIDAEQISVMIARPEEAELYRLASIGFPPEGEGEVTGRGFEIVQTLADWVVRTRESLLLDDIHQDRRWREDTTSFDGSPRSILAVPLMLGAEALGGLLLSHSVRGRFSKDQLELVQAAGNQVAVAVNNAELYRLIRDQAEDLGGLLRLQQVETSRSRAILEAVADGVLVTDASRSITLFNASAEEILGMKRSQVIGKSLEAFAGLFGRAAATWRETINTWSRYPNAYSPGETYAEQITLENGRVVSIRLAPVILRNDFLGTVSIFQDITHQVEVDRLKSDFVATVSHELRTPMTSIKGYVEVLLMGAAGGLSDQQKGFLEVVRTNTDRLADLVNDLLDISRIEAGKVILSPQPVKLEEVISQAVAEIERRSLEERKGVRIFTNISPNTPFVHGDPDRMRQIFDNLLDNAYLYNSIDGEIQVRVYEKEGGLVEIEVRDSGMGVPAREQPHVFERFFRGENPLLMGVSGTGLGLSIVKNLVEMHRGHIHLESPSPEGKGTSFFVTMPAYTPEDEFDVVENPERV